MGGKIKHCFLCGRRTVVRSEILFEGHWRGICPFCYYRHKGQARITLSGLDVDKDIVLRRQEAAKVKRNNPDTLTLILWGPG